VKLGEKIKKMRKMRNLTQEELADKIGVASKHQISLYESGKTIPYADTLQRIAKVLGISLDYLLDDDIENEDIKFMPKINDQDLLRTFEIIDQFPEKERTLVKEIFNALIFKNDIREKVTAS